MDIIIPRPLQKGDRVALLGPSGAAVEENLPGALAAIEKMGLRPRVYPSARARHGYLAGPDALRAADLQAAYQDPDIRGILCSRGGYGAARLLPLLDWTAIAQNPKPLFGYSDITALHIALQNLGHVSYHTPMPTNEWHKGLDAYTQSWLETMLFGRPDRPFDNPPDAPPPVRLSGGTARGPLCGGNLSLVAKSLGTPWEIDTRGKILFLEEVHEEPYRVDGYLTALRNSGKLAACAGIVLGAFTDAQPARPERSLSMAQVFEELITPLGKPAMAGLLCGHCLPTLSLPLGRTVILDADAPSLAPA